MATRRETESVRERGTMTRRAALRTLAAAGAAVAGTGAYGFLYGRHELDVTRIAVSVRGLPATLSGLRVGFLSDVHRSRWVSHDDVTSAVGALMAERPELIILGGDYVTWGDREFVQPAAEALAALSAPQGVFGILGNHDDDHDMPAALARRGIEMLRDARTRITIRNEIVDLVG
ncbi:MAG TPA: metallophosphoesterase, partial [Vicinamibacterales bacterium]